MRIYEKEVIDKQESKKETPVVDSELEVLECVAKVEEPKFVEEISDTWVIKVGDLWFKLLLPYTLVESREDAVILTADVARAQAHRIRSIKKMSCSIEKA